jgi:selenocysteine lyase/cysteine desulfurase
MRNMRPKEPISVDVTNTYFGPHLGVAYGRREVMESWRPYKVRPAPNQPLEVMKRLGLEDDGGAVRVGFVHYNTVDEVDRLLDELARLE